MNGNWYPWGQRAPERFVAMWRHVRRVFDDAGLGPSHLLWIWCVTNRDHGPFAAEAFYPGDDWVDWLGLDGYNWGASRPDARWEPPAAVLEPMLRRLRALSARPVAITEVATTGLTRTGDDPAAKNTWIRDYFRWLRTAGVRMACWYNVDRDAEFSVFGTREFAAYRAGVRDWPVTPDRGGPRLISDASFAGQ